MRIYYLRRHEDVSGNSGCGRVAQVAEFDDGTAVLHWNRGANASGVTAPKCSPQFLICSGFMATREGLFWSQLSMTMLWNLPAREEEPC